MKFYYIYCTAFILNGQIKHSTNLFTLMISRGKAIEIENEKQNELTLPNFN